MTRFFFRCCFVLLIIIGVLVVLWAINIFFTEKSAKDWPTAKGTVIKAEILTHKPTRNIRYGGGKNPSYTPRWTYEFYIDKHMYTSDRTAFGTSSTYAEKIKAESELSLYPVGSKVEVIYNPENPNKAALKISNGNSIFWELMSFGFLFSSTGILFLSTFFRQTRGDAQRL